LKFFKTDGQRKILCLLAVAATVGTCSRYCLQTERLRMGLKTGKRVKGVVFRYHPTPGDENVAYSETHGEIIRLVS